MEVEFDKMSDDKSETIEMSDDVSSAKLEGNQEKSQEGKVRDTLL